MELLNGENSKDKRAVASREAAPATSKEMLSLPGSRAKALTYLMDELDLRSLPLFCAPEAGHRRTHPSSVSLFLFWSPPPPKTVHQAGKVGLL